jgi:transposase
MEYRRLLAILQKAEGRTFEDIANEQSQYQVCTEMDCCLYPKWYGWSKDEMKKTGGSKSSVTDENREIILSALFNDPHLFGYLRNTWSLRSLTECLTNELGIPISFKHLQRITKDLGVRCKRPKLELLHDEDYEEGKERVENYKQIASALKKRELQ